MKEKMVFSYVSTTISYVFICCTEYKGSVYGFFWYTEGVKHNISVLILGMVVGAIGAVSVIYLYDRLTFTHITPLSQESVADIPRPLLQYSIPELSKRTPQAGSISLDRVIETVDEFTTYQFSYTTQGKKVTGLAHIPNGDGPFPVIVQFRGYVDREIYQTGIGTNRSGAAYARNGYITLAPDFLGYGDSDMPSTIVLEERFQTYTTALDLLYSVSSLKKADPDRIGIWGHSNGGHIALTVLAIINRSIPTTLWAPVTKPFPYSILYFTDELYDNGKFLRGELARFEGLYDVNEFTFRSYLDRLKAPILLHQGTADDAVPVQWSDDFVNTLSKGIVTYYRYPGAGHNMEGSWQIVVDRDIAFFNEYLQ